MEKTFFFLIVAALCFSCSDDNLGGTSDLPTDLEIKVVELASANIPVGATVSLYLSESDMKNNTNRVALQTVNSQGIAFFKNVAKTFYYIYVQHGCKSNLLAETHTISLTPHIKNWKQIIISGTGTLVLNNTSNNPYSIYIGGVYQFNMNGKTTRSIPNLQSEQLYTIRVLQVSGYALYPTDKTYTGALHCGGTFTTTFP